MALHRIPSRIPVRLRPRGTPTMPGVASAGLLATALAAASGGPAAAQGWSGRMMTGSGMGGVMWGMGLVWLLILVLAVLGVMALVKYLFRG